MSTAFLMCTIQSLLLCLTSSIIILYCIRQGHAADDNVLPDSLQFTNAVSAVADSDGNGNVSNWEFYDALDPNEMSKNDYVFDNFEWTHCEGQVNGNSKAAGDDEGDDDFEQDDDNSYIFGNDY